MLLATARTDIAGILSSIIYVYTILIFVHIVVQLLFQAGIRIPYSRATNGILQFLRDVCEPFLRLFRRLIPGMGGWDFSPMLAVFTLVIVNRVVVEGIIHG
ncbi:MAG TPA: YggT family protein [Solirubrobacteraceae bacterium]|nr:YggT family protein [Solirubrobacteraceae bacterium]